MSVVRSKHRWAFLLLTAALSGCSGAQSETKSPDAAPASAGQKFRIVLGRSSKPGVEQRISRTKETIKEFVVSKDGKLLKESNERTMFRFAGTETVVELGPDGDAKKQRFVVEHFTIQDAGAQRDILAAGTVIDKQRLEKESAYAIEGKPVEGELDKLLKDFFGASGSGASGGDSGDDRIFGTDVPRAVGESWPIDAELAKKEFADSEMAPKSVSGTTRLASLKTIDHVDCLEIESNFKLVGDISATAGFPEGTKVELMDMDARMLALVPVDTSKPMISGSFTLTARTKARVPSPQGEVLVEVTMNQSQIDNVLSSAPSGS